jgi:hypothetical protein
MKQAWKLIVPCSHSNLEKNKIPLNILLNLPHNPGYIPDFCKNKEKIAKSKFLTFRENG